MAAFAPRVTHGKKINTQAREFIWGVSEFMKKEADDPNNCTPLNKCL